VSTGPEPDRHDDREAAIAAAPDLDALAGLVVECRSCPRLVAWREKVAADKRAAYRDEDYWGRPVPGFGDPDAHLLIVGLAPAAHGANRTGRMFTGDRSGDFLFAALHRAGYASQSGATARDDGLVLDGTYITAPVRCAPPQNKPTAEERAMCRPFLRRELELLAGVKVVLALGQIGYVAAMSELGGSPRPRFAHGLEVELPGGSTLLCSYHVSQQNTFTGRLTEKMFDEILIRARRIASD
jgi:uracil-DNA glycosylase family 4